MPGLFKVFDAANPPATAPPGCAGVLGYIGGARAARIWTLPEWERFAGLAQFPAWVPDTAQENPQASAVRAGNAMRGLGWAPWQADRRVLVTDLETQVVARWFQQFAAELEQQGFTAVAYGSESAIADNFAADNWVAAWDGAAQLLPGQTIHAHQYQANVSFGGTQVDYSTVDDWLFARAGVGPRHT